MVALLKSRGQVYSVFSVGVSEMLFSNIRGQRVGRVGRTVTRIAATPRRGANLKAFKFACMQMCAIRRARVGAVQAIVTAFKLACRSASAECRGERATVRASARSQSTGGRGAVPAGKHARDRSFRQVARA